MPVHDAYARTTPYELAFPSPGFPDERFPEIEEEAEAREPGALADPGRFVMLAGTGRALRDIRGPDEPAERIHQHGLLLFHAYWFWKAEEPLLVLDTGAARYLVEAGPRTGGWRPSLPGPAGYLQLPRHLFWARSGEEGHAEPLDGFFWSAPDPEVLHLLVVTGLREGRPGMGVIPLPGLPAGEAGEWASTEVREGGDDFSTTLPGGELEGLYSVEAAGEVLKLAARVFWYIDTVPGSRSPGRPAEAGGEAGDEGAGGANEAAPAPSALGYTRIGLAAGPAENT